MYGSETLFRPDLEGALLEYNLAAEREGYIAHQLLPHFGVPVQTGIFSKIPADQLLQLYNTERAPSAGFQRGATAVEQDAYQCKVYGYEEPVDDAEREILGINAEAMAAEIAQAAVLRTIEANAAAALYDTTTIDSTSVDSWVDSTSADPIGDVNAAKLNIARATGIRPNAVVMGAVVYDALLQISSITDKIKNVQSIAQGAIGNEDIARIFGVEKVFIGEAAKSITSKNLAVSAYSIFPEDAVLVCRVANTDRLNEPCIGRTFVMDQADMPNVRIQSYREEQTISTIVRALLVADQKVLYPELGYVLSFT